jgi:DNA repair exonuclease SbcCD ATPase subunit
MFIKITEVKFKNFMSYIEETIFIPENGVVLINGKNGNGKSSILESVYYGLFGKPFRKISQSELINTTTNRDMQVQISFEIGTDSYSIIRGQKPQKFEIYKNSDLILQDSKSLDYQKMLEESILKTNESVFKQLVLLGANIPTSKNFSELSNKEREDLFKYIIDIGIFSEYSEIAKTRIKELKQEFSQADTSLNQLVSLKEKLKQDIERQEIQNANIEDSKSLKIAELQEEQKVLKENITKLESANEILGISKTEEIQSISLEITDLTSQANKSKNIISTSTNQLALISKLESSHNSCLSCSELVKISGIDISEKPALEEQRDYNTNIVETCKIRLNELNEQLTKLQEINKKIELVNQKLNSFNSSYNNIDEKIKIIRDVQPAVIDYSTLEDISEQEKNLIQNKIELESKIIDFISFQDLVSDKNLKGHILEQSLPVINKWINYFLESFGNFPFLFTINSDLTESIFTMDGSNLQKSFNSLSNGQKLRIVFSILFSFLKYSEERNTTHYNILFLDEVLDSSLDTEGRIELINILRTEFQDRSINIISHNQEIREAEEIFENIYTIESAGIGLGSKLKSHKEQE